MRQVECPNCQAPMWEGGRCPWDRGDGVGCRGKALRVYTLPLGRRERAETPKVAPVRSAESRAAARPRAPRLAEGEARARKIARSLAYNAAHRALVTASCATCATTIEVHHGGPARKHCSPRCRGRYERSQR